MNPPEPSEPGIIALQPYSATLLCFGSGPACLPRGLRRRCFKPQTTRFANAVATAERKQMLSQTQNSGHWKFWSSLPEKWGFCYYWFAKTQEYIIHCITFRWSHPKQNNLVGPLILIKHLGSRDCATIPSHWQGFCHETFVMFLKQIFLW